MVYFKRFPVASLRQPILMDRIHLCINLSNISTYADIEIEFEDPKDLMRKALQMEVNTAVEEEEQAVLRVMSGWIETNLEFVTHAGYADATRKAFLFGRKGGAGPDVATVEHGHLNAHWPFVTPAEE